jgi:hypothetical protein
LTEVVGIYLNPPEQSTVLRVNEKADILRVEETGEL